jgi:branched-chain amino acid transport system substrate-binding protein
MPRSSLPLLILLAATGCARPREPVRLGVVLGMDGVAAARMAIADANADPRAVRAGLSLELVTRFETSGFEPLRAIAAADDLTADPRVLGVVGHSNSASSIAAAQIYNRERLPQLAPAASATPYGRAGPYSYRLVPDDSRQGAVLARILASDSSRPRIAVVYDNDDYGRTLRQAVHAGLRGSRVQVVYETPVTGDFGPATLELVARAVDASQPQVLVWLARTAQLQQILPLLRSRRSGLSLLASDALDTPPVYARDNRGFAGMRFIRFVDPSNRDPAFQRFRTRFAASTGHEVSAVAVLAYDAVRLMAEPLLAGANSRAAVQAYLQSRQGARDGLPGLAGPILIDSLRNGVRGYQLAEVGADGVVRGIGRF